MSRNAEAIMGVAKSKMARQAERIAELEAALAGIEVKLARDQDVDGAMRILLAAKK